LGKAAALFDDVKESPVHREAGIAQREPSDAFPQRQFAVAARCFSLFFFAVISLLRFAKSEDFRGHGSGSGCFFLEITAITASP